MLMVIKNVHELTGKTMKQRVDIWAYFLSYQKRDPFINQIVVSNEKLVLCVSVKCLHKRVFQENQRYQLICIQLYGEIVMKPVIWVASKEWSYNVECLMWTNGLTTSILLRPWVSDKLGELKFETNKTQYTLRTCLWRLFIFSVLYC